MAAGPAYYRDAAVRGNTFQRAYQCQTADGSPVNLTGYGVKWRGVYGDVTIEKTTADELVMTTPTNGTVILTLVPAETRLIPAEENMKYELEVYQGASQQTVLWGDLVGKGGASSD
jgi:phosphosulfolactate phosphohydrolase-like enzyme